MLTTRVRPTGGHALVGGVDVVAAPVHARGRLAVVPPRSNLDRSISIRRNLTFHAAYHGVPAAEAEARANELLEEFGLRQRGNVKPDLFSGGQAQRVMIARALMHQPQVLFLDEPTTGLDPAARLLVWDRLRELRERGVTLFLTTHDMHEAALLADRVGIMDRGKLLALDTPEALIRSLPGSSTLELTTQPAAGNGHKQLIEALAQLSDVERVEHLHDDGSELRARLYVSGEAAQLVAPAATLLAERGLSLSGVEIGAPSLEDVFIHLTGRSLR
jgi:ABC-2 type transport system ATP-binding protein